MKNETTIAKVAEIEVGDFISIPSWKVTGQVVDTKVSAYAQVLVTVQERPEQETGLRSYRLNDGQFEFEI